MSEKVRKLFDNVSFDISDQKGDDILDWVESAEFDEMIKNREKVPDTSVDGIVKIMNVCSELYKKDPEIFKIKFNIMIGQMKLHMKIRETYSSKEEINRVFGSISFFDAMVKKNQGYNHAYEESSKHYKIPEKYLRSIIGTRNALRRNPIKIQ